MILKYDFKNDFNRQMINLNIEHKDDLYDEGLYYKIIQINSLVERTKIEEQLLKKATEFKCKTEIKNLYNTYKKQKQFELRANNIIDFGNFAPIKEMIAPNYYKDKKNCIYMANNGMLVTSTPIEPVAILKNNETGEELVKCSFLKNNYWQSFIVDRETLLHNGKIMKIAKKGVDVTTDSSRLLVAFMRDLLNNNEIPEHISTSKMGWCKDLFIPYDTDIEFDGEEDFKNAFNALHSKGSYEKWLSEMYSVRENNVPMRLMMSASFASILLNKLHRDPFVTMFWGTTGSGKTAAGRVAMSIWGDSKKGSLMFSMDNTNNFYTRTADFFNNLPVFFDELQTYKGNIDRLIMILTEGIDRRKS